MKQEIIKEVNEFYNVNDGCLNREETLVISEAIIEPRRTKPSKRILRELREIKKKRKESSFYPTSDNSPDRSIEYSIGTIVSQKKRGLNRIHQINKVIELLRELQRKYNYEEISKEFLNTIIKQNSNLKNNSRCRLLNKIIKKAKTKRQRIIEKKYLVGEKHFEKKIKGELTKSSITPVDRVWEYYKTQEVVFFSFI